MQGLLLHPSCEIDILTSPDNSKRMHARFSIAVATCRLRTRAAAGIGERSPPGPAEGPQLQAVVLFWSELQQSSQPTSEWREYVTP